MEKKKRRFLIKDNKRTHIILFLLTFLFTTLAGAEWMFGRSFVFGPWKMGWKELIGGLEFSIPFLLILTVHEFGHYFTAQYHKVRVSLPFYIPLWLGFIGAPTIGTMGAFIRIKDKVFSRIQNFDIGVAGPVSGFIVALVVLWYGFTHLPPKEHIYSIHPEYEVLGLDFDKYIYTQDTFILKSDVEQFNKEYAQYLPDTLRFSPDLPSIAVGSTLLFGFFKQYVVPESDKDRIPNDFEMMHYPWLLAGFLALFFTALNMLPIGQLDGGHVIYGLFGAKNHAIISRVFFIVLIYYSGLGLISPFESPGSGGASEYLLYIPLYVFFLYYILARFTPEPKNKLMIAVAIFTLQFLTVQFFPDVKGYNGWLLFAFLIGRFIGLDYPPARFNEPLDSNRQMLGWFALFIFVISFSLKPLIVA